MTALLLCLVSAALVLAGGWGLLTAGLRVGDRVGDTTLTAVEADAAGDGLWFTVHNGGHQAVLLGASVRRRTVRLWLEGGSFTSVPRRTAQPSLLAGEHALVRAIGAGATETVRVGLSNAGRRAELIVTIGEADRLRVLHRAVDLPGAPPPLQVEPIRRPASVPADRAER